MTFENIKKKVGN